MKIQDYDAYLFDMDGTIAQAFELWLGIIRGSLDTYGITMDDKAIVRTIFGNARNGMIEVGVPESNLDEIFRKWDKKAVQQYRQVGLYPDVEKVLRRLSKQGKRLALVTATMRPTIEALLEARGLDDVFEVLVTGTDITADKPDPQSVQLALTGLGIEDKSRALMLGDSEKDIRAAHNAGIDSLLFYPPEHKAFHSLAQLQADNPTYTIRSWQELLDQLQ